MNDIQDLYKTVLGLIIIITSIALAIWLSLYVMLYGGIMQTLENWGINNSAVAWGIIKAGFFHIGVIPAYIVIRIAMELFE
ncbi:MAG: hypothetical protein PVH61_44320 [Candidatus Aminicenantes bacterium]|jgi:hypothetical protein